jgi:hypothetical protein
MVEVPLGKAPDRQRTLVLLAVLAAVIIAGGILTFIRVSPGGGRSTTIDAAQARMIARDFFMDAHGPDPMLGDVRFLGTELERDNAGRWAWVVELEGDVAGTDDMVVTYPSAMLLSIDAETGEVTIVAQG